MKKFVKIEIIVLVVLILITIPMVINCVRNYQIYKKIEEAGSEFFSSSNYQVTEKSSFDNYEYIYYKDNICLSERVSDSEENNIDAYWKDFSTGEEVFTYQEIYKAQGTSVDYSSVITSLKDLATLKLSNKPLFKIIKEEDGSIF